MGGDTSPEVLFSAVINAADEIEPKYRLAVFVGREYESLLPKRSNIDIIYTSDTVLMDDDPLYAARKKTSSSMAEGIKALKENRIAAFVSTGNTGALTAMATLELEKLPSVLRPALMALLPTEKGHVAVLDVGANVASRPQNLLQFAQMGAAYQKCVNSLSCPKVGLLNIGVEARKGTKKTREAYGTIEKYSQSNTQLFQFEGNIEGRDVFHGKVDVLVTDGFTGNVFLKTCEGVSSFVIEYIHSKVKAKKNIFFDFERLLHYEAYPGAILAGIASLVIKSHGNSSSKALFSSILGAKKLLEADLIEKMKQFLEKI